MYERRRKFLLIPTSVNRELILDKYEGTEKRLEEIKTLLSTQHCAI